MFVKLLCEKPGGSGYLVGKKTEILRSLSVAHTVPVRYTGLWKENGVEAREDDTSHPQSSTPSTSGLGKRTHTVQRLERQLRIVPQAMPDLTAKNVSRLERRNWVTGTGWVEDLQGETGGLCESIHRNRLE